MSSAAPKIIEEKPDLIKRRNKNLEVKILSHKESKQLQDAARIKYKKAFEALKDM